MPTRDLEEIKEHTGHRGHENSPASPWYSNQCVGAVVDERAKQLTAFA